MRINSRITGYSPILVQYLSEAHLWGKIMVLYENLTFITSQMHNIDWFTDITFIISHSIRWYVAVSIFLLLEVLFQLKGVDKMYLIKIIIKQMQKIFQIYIKAVHLSFHDFFCMQLYDSIIQSLKYIMYFDIPFLNYHIRSGTRGLEYVCYSLSQNKGLWFTKWGF